MRLVESIQRPQRGEKINDLQAMAWAIEEAKQGATRVSPNPLVGSVVVDAQGNFLSSGHHEFYGGPHAEVNAVQGLTTEELQGATVFVTLEPCAHEGKTPSCAKMLAKLPIKKVVYGLVDPNPLVAGQGAQILIESGIQAELFSVADIATNEFMHEQLEQVCEAFLKNFRNKEVFVGLKIATSLDGQISLENGESKWITGDEARLHSHYLRACYDMICVGAGTIRKDDPSLDVRHPSIQKEIKVLVIDPRGDIAKKFSQYKISKIHKAENIFFAVSDELIFAEFSNFPQELRRQIIPVSLMKKNVLNLKELLQKLYELKIRSLYVEGGGVTASAFLEQKLVDRLYIFQAPVLLGAGKSWTSGIHLESMAAKLQLRDSSLILLGKDFMVSGKLDTSSEPFEKLNSKKFDDKKMTNNYRWIRGNNGWFFGVCDGLAKTFELEPWILRVIFFLSFYLFGAGLGLYLILAISLPREDKLDKAHNRKILGVCARIAKRSQIEIGLVRAAFVALAVGTLGVAFLVYLALYFVYPKD